MTETLVDPQLSDALTIPRAATLIGLNKDTLRRHLKAGLLESHTVAGHTLITRAEATRHRDALFPEATSDVRSAAIRLGVGASSIYSLIRGGFLFARKVNRHVRITNESLDAYIDRYKDEKSSE